MIGKLRKKFILINMTLVSLVLLMVFLGILGTSYQSQKMESIRSMERLIYSPSDLEPPILQINGKQEESQDKFRPMTPVFSVAIGENGEIQAVKKMSVTVSDQVVSQVTQQVLSSGKPDGILMKLQLRYITRDTPDGKAIAFADLSRERSSLTSLATSLLLIGTGGLAAFFLISLFLSRWALHPVEKAWEQQRQFVADASHELKTPLTVILANMGILQSHRDDFIANQNKWVENTRAEAERMKALVDDLLFLAKTDAGRQTPVVRTKFNLSDAVWNSILHFESVAFERGITLESSIEPDLSLVGDAGQLRQLVLLLLDNACKFAGDSGAVFVSLSRKIDQVQLSVTNTGEPISKEHLPHIFERFYRVDSARARSQGGYGLGLAIGRSIVESHGGLITAASSKEEGTTFTVTLPY